MCVHERACEGRETERGGEGECLAAGLMKDVRRMLTRQSPCMLLIEMGER